MRNLLALSLLLAASGVVHAEVGVAITIGDPGFFGRIDIGDAPRPRLIYAEPIIVMRPAVVVSEPLYLRVPPGHAKHWGKNCHKYDACSRQVYFVHDDWYEREYVPHYRVAHGHGKPGHGNGGKGHGKSKDKGKDKDKSKGHK